MKARKVLVFLGLIIAVLFFTVKIVQAYFIDNSDIPVNDKCIGQEGFADAFLIGEKKPVGWNPAIQWWGDPNAPKATIWAPEFAGIKVSVKTQNTTVRFVFSQEQILV